MITAFQNRVSKPFQRNFINDIRKPDSSKPILNRFRIGCGSLGALTAGIFICNVFRGMPSGDKAYKAFMTSCFMITGSMIGVVAPRSTIAGVMLIGIYQFKNADLFETPKVPYRNPYTPY